MTTKRGGDLGGSPTVRRVTLSPKAARIVRNAYIIRYGDGRQRKDETNEVASRLIEQRYETLRPAMAWLEQTSAMCFDSLAKAALEAVLLELKNTSADP